MRRLLLRLSRKVTPPTVLTVRQAEMKHNAEHEEILRRKGALEDRVYRLQSLSDLRSRTSEERR